MAITDSLSGVFGGFGNSWNTAKSLAGNFLWGIGILIVVGIIGYFIYKSYRDKAVYNTPVTLTRILENGIEKTRHDLRGGIFWNNNIKDFKIKIPKERKPHILGYIPDFSKASTTDSRLHFIISGDGTIWQQYEEKWILRERIKDEEGNIFEYNLIKKPVPREIKQVTVNSIKNWKETIDKKKLTVFGIAIGAFLIMVIAHLISLYVQTKIKCPVIP